MAQNMEIDMNIIENKGDPHGAPLFWMTLD
jgi:hypothetical protein